MPTRELRWDASQQEKNLGDDPTKAQISALFAIPGDTKSDSKLPHHDVSADGKVGAADKQGCVAAITALNGGRGGLTGVSAAEKDKAYSHLASHLRELGEEPPEKKFSAPRRPDQGFNLRRRRRGTMTRALERRSMPFVRGNVEVRALADGTGGTTFEFSGYGAVFDTPFEMWDWWGDPYTEVVRQGAFSRTLGADPDVPFLIGHNDAGIPLARTRAGTMTLSQDAHGLQVRALMDGSRSDVRNLASAVERGDCDEMSIGFLTIGQEWSPDWETRAMTDLELHRGDVSAVALAANAATAGSSMTAFPVSEAVSRRRPGGEQRTPTQPYTAHPGETNACPQCGSVNADSVKFCDQCGTAMQPRSLANNMAGVEDLTQQCGACQQWNSADAKYCCACGGELTGGQGGGGYDAFWWKSQRRPGAEQRSGGEEVPDTSTSPDSSPGPPKPYDESEHGPGSVICQHPGCPVDGGARNAPDAKYCDQCGGPLYNEDGTIVLDDSGVVEEVGGAMADADLLMRRTLTMEHG